MKNTYISAISQVLRPQVRILLLLLLVLPFASLAQSITITPTNPGDPQDFGTIAVGQRSSSNSYTLSANGLSRDVTVSIPSGFEGSLNNATFTTGSLTIVRSGQTASGTIYLRFAPTEEINYDDFLYAFSRSTTNASLFSNDVRVVGVGSMGTPTITVNPEALSFGTQLINTKSASKAVTVTATALTEGIQVTPSTGYEVSLNNSDFTNILSLPATNGSVNTTVYVRFSPTEKQPYTGFLTFTSAGAADRKVDLFGTGDAPATLTSNPTTLNFGTVPVGQASDPQSFTVTGSYLNGDITITPPTNFQIRLPSGTFSTASIVIPFTGTTINQTIEVRLQPVNTNANTNAFVTVSSPSTANANVRVTGQGNQPSATPTITVNPNNLDFGQVSGSGSAQTLTFEVGATNLDGTTNNRNPLVLTASNANISFRDATAGGSFTNGPLIITPDADGNVSLRNIEVRLVAVIASGNFSGTITASSTGADDKVVNITANSIGGSSTINTTGSLQQFSTVPGVASAVQSFQVGASNLLQDAVVVAPQYFQVSLTSDFAGVTTTGNSVTVARNNGNDISPSVTVYVRFVPPVAITTSDLITISSNPATGQGISAAGTSEPSIQVVNSFQEVTKVVINTTSPSQSITISADRVRQPITLTRDVISNTANPSGTAQFELSLNNVDFSNSITLTPSSATYSVNQQVYVRYKPTYLGAARANLQFRSSDFANQGLQTFQTNGQLAGRSIDTEPTKRSTPTITRNGSTAIVSFNLPANYAGLGYGENRLVAASTNPTLPSGSQPADGTPYGTGNQTYGSGPQIVTGYFVVYSGDESTVTVTGLDPTVTYYFYSFEYNNIESSINLAIVGAENYLQPPVPTEIAGIIAPGTPLPVSLVSFTAKLRNKQVALDWKTATEKNNGMFYVERSQDARTYTSILSRAGQGNSEKATSYSAIDDAPLAGTSYYRLKQVDFDGTTSYSSPVAVTNAGSVEVSMYPNPAEDVLNIQIAGSTEGVRATIADLSGRVIRTQVLRADGRLNVRDLRSGTYVVTVGEGNTKVMQRIVKK
ncbi:T9SS type A sorting domain-containing protein [Hymenobacter taeanensis]|uniref:T9SS type A sorting domain-containing protein n=1 Tax=Hymenobacter taeanensis TaxID=2735321 RepID=A0A6M6BB86_9BACT|nr:MULTISPECIES: T9SS type A sorting domain-containing protein [Hymenobacter]QJX45407.1 T9SS type A sorting domain-containing protein [Hymenobacter taeanensis]UOQ81350.1 T9SS type A sorting domain-containing protein [Hymenobacter sp. 5414T-23]